MVFPMSEASTSFLYSPIFITINSKTFSNYVFVTGIANYQYKEVLMQKESIYIIFYYKGKSNYNKANIGRFLLLSLQHFHLSIRGQVSIPKYS